MPFLNKINGDGVDESDLEKVKAMDDGVFTRLIASAVTKILDLEDTNAKQGVDLARLTKEHDENQLKKEVNRQIAVASAACASCLSAVGDKKISSLLTTTLDTRTQTLPDTSSPAPTGKISPALSLINEIATNNDIAQILNAVPKKIQLFITCDSFNGTNKHLKLSPPAQFPLFSFVHPTQTDFLLPWGRDILVNDEEMSDAIGGDLETFLKESNTRELYGNFTITDPASDTVVGVILFVPNPPRELARPHFHAHEDAYDLLGKTLTACIHRIFEKRRNDLDQKFALQTKEIKATLTETASKLKHVTMQRQSFENKIVETTKMSENQTKLLSESESTIKRLESGSRDFQEKLRQVASEKESLKADMIALKRKKELIEEEATKTAHEIGMLRATSDDLMVTNELQQSSLLNLGRLMSCSGLESMCREIKSGVEDILGNVLEEGGVLRVSLLKQPKTGDADANADADADADGDDNAIGDALVDDDGATTLEIKISSQTPYVFGYISYTTASSAISPLARDLLVTYAKVSAFSIARIFRDGDVEKMREGLTFGKAMEGMYAAMTAAWERNLAEEADKDVQSENEVLLPQNRHLAFVSSFESAAIQLLSENSTKTECKFSVKVMFTGAKTSTGLPALSTIRGEVIPLLGGRDEEGCVSELVDCVNGGGKNMVRGAGGIIYVPIRYRANAIPRAKGGQFKVGAVAVFQRLPVDDEGASNIIHQEMHSENFGFSSVEEAMIKRLCVLSEPLFSSSNECNEATASLHAAVSAISTLRTKTDRSIVALERANERCEFLSTSVGLVSELCRRCGEVEIGVEKNIINGDRDAVWKVGKAAVMACLKDPSANLKSFCISLLVVTRKEADGGVFVKELYSDDGRDEGDERGGEYLLDSGDSETIAMETKSPLSKASATVTSRVERTATTAAIPRGAVGFSQAWTHCLDVLFGF